jgi:DnaJ-class molecular chaperone
MAPEHKKHGPPCPTCGGSGQISFFQGESRFLLTDAECPACCGLGYLLDDTNEDKAKKRQQDRKKR